MGGRLLRQWLKQPLTDLTHIEQRQDTIEYLISHRTLLTSLQNTLRQMIDIERLISRIVLNLGSPKDLRSLIEMLGLVWQTKEALQDHNIAFFTQVSEHITEQLMTLRDELDIILLDEPSFDPRQGNVIRSGVDTRLDELRQVVETSQTWIANLEHSERQSTGISTLKIRFNQVFGFYIEVSKANLGSVPDHYLRKQTLVNAERFITPSLKEHEEIILHAKA